MKLVSIANSGGEVASPKPRVLVEKAEMRGAKGGKPSTPYANKRLAIGKSDQPLRAPNGNLMLESIIGVDERTRILDTDAAPWRMVCALEIEGPWGDFIGTGWFVGPRTLITAGHCVFDAKQMGGWAKKITITPGRDQDEKPFGTIVSSKFSTTDKWLQEQDADFDFAAIHLAEADTISEDRGWFGVGSYPNADLLDSLVNVSGYPGDRGNGTEQWWARNRIREVTPRRIFYDVDTMGGQSGAPAYIVPSAGAAPIVVGIHAYGVGGTPASIKLELNSAPRIIPEVVDQIKAWIVQDDGLPE